MIEQPDINWWAVAPELALAIGSLVALLVGLLPSRRAQRTILPLVSLAALGTAIAIAVVRFDNSVLGAWEGQVDSDQLANVGRILAASAGVLTVLFAMRGRADDGRDGEYHALLLAAVCGMGLFAASGTLLTVFVGLELFSIALYVLCAIEAERVESLEAGLKYLIVGGLSSAVLLYGAALTYGATGHLDLSSIGESSDRGLLLYLGAAMLLAGLAFKASAAPLHWWTPDVYEGAPTSITAFMATATKAAAFIATVRVLVVAFYPEHATWEPLVAGLAATSIVVGNLGAIMQHRLKRMLAYSSIAHAGYLLTGIVAWDSIGVAALAYALAVYVVMTMAAFTIVILRERQVGRAATFDDLKGTGWGTLGDVGWLAALPGMAMVVAMLSLAGLPPTAGFFAKFALFSGLVDSGYAWLAVVGVLGSAVSLAYYLRVPVAMYMQAPSERPAVDTTPTDVSAVETPADARGALARTQAAGTSELGIATGDADRHPALATLAVALAAATVLMAFPPLNDFDNACDARQSLLAERTGKAFECGTTSRVAAADRG